MKKLFILICLAFSLTTYGQLRKATFLVPDSSTVFGITLPANTLVFDYGANKLWKLNIKAAAADYLGQFSKTLINTEGADGNGIYTGNGSLTGNTTVTGGGFDLEFDNAELTLGVPVGSLTPLTLYEDRVGGANVGDSYALDFAFNDNTGTRQNGSTNIFSRVVGTGAGTVANSLTFGTILQVRNGGGVLLSQNATTDAPISFFEIDNDAGSSFAGCFLVTNRDDLAGSNMINLRNRSLNSALLINGQNKTTFNNNSISTADIQAKGLTDANTFYLDASTDRVGIGKNNPAEKLDVVGNIAVSGTVDGVDVSTLVSALKTKAGTVVNATFTGNPKTATVTFSTAFSDTNYSPVITCETVNGTSYTPVVESIAAGSFVINMTVNNINDLTAIRWVTIKNGEN